MYNGVSYKILVEELWLSSLLTIDHLERQHIQWVKIKVFITSDELNITRQTQ